MAQVRKRRRRPHPRRSAENIKVDQHVGGQIKTRRKEVGLSQERLGDAMGLTFQQIQKYERGANRVGASRLHDLSMILSRPIAYFFDGLEPKPGEALDSKDDDLLRRKDCIELVRAYYRIKNPAARKRFNELIKSLGRDL